MAREKLRFLVDERGRKQSVVVPIKEYRELMDDLADLATFAERKDEPAESLESVKKVDRRPGCIFGCATSFPWLSWR